MSKTGMCGGLSALPTLAGIWSNGYLGKEGHVQQLACLFSTVY